MHTQENIVKLLERATQEVQDFVKDSMYSKYLSGAALTAYYEHDQVQKWSWDRLSVVLFLHFYEAKRFIPKMVYLFVLCPQSLAEYFLSLVLSFHLFPFISVAV